MFQCNIHHVYPLYWFVQLFFSHWNLGSTATITILWVHFLGVLSPNSSTVLGASPKRTPIIIGSDCQLSWWTYFQIIHNWDHRNFQCLPRFVLASSDVHENQQNRGLHTFLVTSTAKVLQLLLEPQHPELLDLNRDAWPTALAVDLWRCSPLHRAAERGRSEVPAILRGMLLGDCLIYKWDVSIVLWCSMGNILIFRDFLGKIGRILIVFF